MFQDHYFLAMIGLPALFIVAVVAYRLTLHPLARVPGPILAAATGAYEAYFQLVKDGGGRYWIEVDRLHDIYGPIVRINPWEVHIKDSNWNDVYKLSSKANKPWWYYRSFGSAQSTNTTEPDQLHRVHRQALQVWFSSQNVTKNIPKVQDTVEQLHDRLASSFGQVINLSDAYRSLALDVTTAFAFQRPFGGLADPNFSKDFNQAIRSYGRIGLLNRHFFGIPSWILQSLPDAISNKISPKALQVFMAKVNECARYSFNRPIQPDDGPQDVVQSMLAADLPEKQKTFTRVFGDCRSLILAGNETTSTVLTSVTYHALTNPEIHARLRSELKDARAAKGSALEYQELRALPYMTGVINEAMRTSNSVSGRLPRYSNVADFQYQQYFLPRGTHISVCMNDMHMDPKIFSEPEKFNPDRWLNQADYKRLMKYLQPWGRGSRLCVGKELAYIDLVLTVARLFGPECSFSLKLYETKQSDWDIFGDYFAPMPGPGSRGLRVMIEPIEKSF
ncbi:Cytochrome P450 [Akanthomyces lecanii RCEF 1005]|uniref:Cytochrome P450 n=1 Tax=Akanthomyces lecanii RCEF 1005 TaxID=1081108 RepID=A0A168F997_CORDF|nr:Cytochrome P450 [Akanthomyces lecanii RCEF 1005]